MVFAKPAVQGADRVLEYLGRYVHRTALAESALVASDERGVTFRYRDSRDQRQKTMTLTGQEFLWRFLQHVPPKGFHRVRAFGLLHPHHRSELSACNCARQQDEGGARRALGSTTEACAPLSALRAAVRPNPTPTTDAPATAEYPRAPFAAIGEPRHASKNESKPQ